MWEHAQICSLEAPVLAERLKDDSAHDQDMRGGINEDVWTIEIRSQDWSSSVVDWRHTELSSKRIHLILQTGDSHDARDIGI